LSSITRLVKYGPIPQATELINDGANTFTNKSSINNKIGKNITIY